MNKAGRRDGAPGLACRIEKTPRVRTQRARPPWWQTGPWRERLAERGKVDGLERVDGLPVGQVVEVAGSHGDRAVAEKLGDDRDRRPGLLELDREGVPQAVRVNPLVDARLAARRRSRTPHVVIGDRLAVEGAEQLAVRPALAAASWRRVSIQRASASSADGWKPRVCGLPRLVSSSRTVCLARFTSPGRSASSSEMRSPERYSSVSIARLRIPVGAVAEHSPMRAATSAGVSGSAAYFLPLFGAIGLLVIISTPLVRLLYLSRTLSGLNPTPLGLPSKSRTQSGGRRDTDRHGRHS